MCLPQTTHWSKGDILLWLAGLAHMPPLELDVEASLPELLAGEGEMGKGVQKKNSRL